jgi:hypothetical protein
MATDTANGLVSYSSVAYGKSYDEWVHIAHTSNCMIHKWTFYPLKPGSYGYDSIVVSFQRVFSNPEFPMFVAEMDVEAVSRLVHAGWVANVFFWIETLPFENDARYIKPLIPIERREACARLEYEELTEEDKDKHRFFARFLITKCSSVV